MKRVSPIFAVLALMTGAALGTPVKPDVRQLLMESQAPAQQFAPARAGWQGPETPPPIQASLNPMLDSVAGPARAQAIRASLLHAIIPDPRALALVAAVIYVLRRIRHLQPSVKSNAAEPGPKRAVLAA